MSSKIFGRLGVLRRTTTVAVAALVAAIGVFVSTGLAQAQTPVLLGFPDATPNDTLEIPNSGRFINVSQGLASLGDTGESDRVFTVEIAIPASLDEFNISIFDGDLSGLWDLGSAGSFQFELYRDPNREASTDPNDLLLTWDVSTMTDNRWCDLDDGVVPGDPLPTYPLVGSTQCDGAPGLTTSTLNRVAAACPLYPNGQCYYHLVVNWLATPSENRANLLKVAAEGQVFLLAGSSVGFQGDSRNGSTYNGKFEFDFYVREEVDVLDIFDGDFDNRVDTDDSNSPSGDPNQPLPNQCLGTPVTYNYSTLNPPAIYTVQAYINTQDASLGCSFLEFDEPSQAYKLVEFPPFQTSPSTLAERANPGAPQDDVLDCTNSPTCLNRSPDIRWTLAAPFGAWTTTNNNPSGNSEWELYRVGSQAATADVPAPDVIVPSIQPGLYRWVIDGADALNNLFVYLEYDVYPGGGQCDLALTKTCQIGVGGTPSTSCDLGIGESEVIYKFTVQNVSANEVVSNVVVVDSELGQVGGPIELQPGASQTFEVPQNIFMDTSNVATAVGFQGANQCVVNDSARVRIPTPGAIGNYVWVDENSDGYQDAGEPGIPNVTVVLYDADGAEVARTQTDAHGGYIFAGLKPGDYYVDVLDGTGNQPNTLPQPGMTQTPPSTLPGADFGNQDHGATPIPNTSFTGYPASVGPDEENLTADFGYNYNPADCVNDPADASCSDKTAALGDRVWVDADGDGVQDPNEVGIPGVLLNLVTAGPDGLFNTPDDVVAATTSTNATGYYIFDSLPPDAYVVVVDPSNYNVGSPLEGYTQTGDPDHFASSIGTNDDKTTVPVVLGPGDVFLNADFGYQPATAYQIGDTVFFDISGNGVLDSSDSGIAGVTVSLLDSNGVVIATDVTDSQGQYLFPGLPNGKYTVWINDTERVLHKLAQTSTPDNNNNGGQPCGLCNGTNSVEINGGDNLNQDFGYSATNQGPLLGLIGDTVFIDAVDNGGGYNPTEGDKPLEGVKVVLTDNNGKLIDTRTTNENGNYYFGGLNPDKIYIVTVVTSTLPAGLTPTYDGDDTSGSGIIVTPNTSTVTLTPSNRVNLDQDFGYKPDGEPGSIGDLVWKDINADGVKQPSEAGIGGVTLDLYYDRNGNGVVDPGEPRVSSTSTAPDGSYLFSNLPTADNGVGAAGADYVVDVTDVNGVLNGYWHSLGATGVNDNSQVDPYAASISAAAPDNLTADFGYYVDPAALGNRVWEDSGGNGIQDAGEPALANVTVRLTITYPDGTVTTLATTSDANGFYSFGNLLLDEDYNRSTAGDPAVDGLPKYTITADTPAGYTVTIIGAGTSKDDSNDPAGTVGLAVQGAIDVSAQPDPNSETDAAAYDFGYKTSGDCIPCIDGISAMTLTLTYRSANFDPNERIRVRVDNGTGYPPGSHAPTGPVLYDSKLDPRYSGGGTPQVGHAISFAIPENVGQIVVTVEGYNHKTEYIKANFFPDCEMELGDEDGNNYIKFTVTDVVRPEFEICEYGVCDTGQIRRDVWKSISGSSVSALTSNPDFPGRPTFSDARTRFEAPTNWADNYGTRMYGYVVAPVTGAYKFWVASDDNSQLWLSTDDAEANKSQIASVPGWTSSRQWTKFPAQQSVSVNLAEGERYFIEALQKEGTGGDNLAVAWQIGDGSVGVIPGWALCESAPPPPLDCTECADAVSSMTLQVVYIAPNADPNEIIRVRADDGSSSNPPTGEVLYQGKRTGNPFTFSTISPTTGKHITMIEVSVKGYNHPTEYVKAHFTTDCSLHVGQQDGNNYIKLQVKNVVGTAPICTVKPDWIDPEKRTISNETKTWTSLPVDISDEGQVCLSLNASSSGPMEDSGRYRDWLTVSYWVDYGPENIIRQFAGNGAVPVSMDLTTGDTVFIQVSGSTSAGDEVYTFKDVAVTVGACGNVALPNSLPWMDGDGPHQATDTRGEVVWSSPELNISGAVDPWMSLRVRSIGDMEGPRDSRYHDWFRVYYVLNGGPEQLIQGFDGKINNSSKTYTPVNGDLPSGQTLKIVIRTRVSAGNEAYRFTLLKVFDANAPVTSAALTGASIDGLEEAIADQESDGVEGIDTDGLSQVYLPLVNSEGE